MKAIESSGLKASWGWFSLQGCACKTYQSARSARCLQIRETYEDFIGFGDIDDAFHGDTNDAAADDDDGDDDDGDDDEDGEDDEATMMMMVMVMIAPGLLNVTFNNVFPQS